jgi:predicted DsbA family dithiol-disulfide isomerase
MRSSEALRRLRADSSLAEELGIRTAPTFVGYGHVEVGAAPGRTLQALMEFVVPASTSHAAPGSTK